MALISPMIAITLYLVQTNEIIKDVFWTLTVRLDYMCLLMRVCVDVDVTMESTFVCGIPICCMLELHFRLKLVNPYL